MKSRTGILLILIMVMLLPAQVLYSQDSKDRPVAEKILFIGDSMTGWLAERLQAYGKQNGFEVATVVWDGSTISKWGKSTRLPSLIKEQKPDVIFVSLGMNDLFETNPESRFKSSLEAIMGAAGKTPVMWVGPPSWPGHNKGEIMNSWLSKQLGVGHYYNSFDLQIPRQSQKNPHPTRNGMILWMDNVVDWIKDNGAVALPGYTKPAGEQMTRGKTFIYKRMKENF